MNLKVGNRVKFRPSHQKDLELTGEVQEISEDHKTVDVLSEEHNGSAPRLYTVHESDCSSPLEDGPVDDPPGQASE